LHKGIKDAKDLLHLLSSEKDEQIINELEQDIIKLSNLIESLEFQKMFSGPMDKHNAYLDIQSGAVELKHKIGQKCYSACIYALAINTTLIAVIRSISRRSCGNKSATVKFTGDYAYGWLRTETGVHRLVRKSLLTLTTNVTLRLPRFLFIRS